MGFSKKSKRRRLPHRAFGLFAHRCVWLLLTTGLTWVDLLSDRSRSVNLVFQIDSLPHQLPFLHYSSSFSVSGLVSFPLLKDDAGLLSLWYSFLFLGLLCFLWGIILHGCDGFCLFSCRETEEKERKEKMLEPFWKAYSSLLRLEELSFLVVSFPNFSQKSNRALRNLNKIYGFCLIWAHILTSVGFIKMKIFWVFWYFSYCWCVFPFFSESQHISSCSLFCCDRKQSWRWSYSMTKASRRPWRMSLAFQVLNLKFLQNSL